MFGTIRTAVAAIAEQQTRNQVIHVISAEGITLEAMEEDAPSALHALGELRSDLLLVDAQLPVLDGIALTRRICESYLLPVRPAVMLLHYPEFSIANEGILADLGVQILEKPLSIQAFGDALRRIGMNFPVFSCAQRKRAGELLDVLGFPPHRGRECMENAILLCAADERYRFDLGGRLYPALGKILRLDASQAERAMRHAIDLAWQSDKFENQYRIFADTVDAGRGQPTCGEMISRLADILRLEG